MPIPVCWVPKGPLDPSSIKSLLPTESRCSEMDLRVTASVFPSSSERRLKQRAVHRRCSLVLIGFRSTCQRSSRTFSRLQFFSNTLASLPSSCTSPSSCIVPRADSATGSCYISSQTHSPRFQLPAAHRLHRALFLALTRRQPVFL
jgi:hypothetical protein